MDVLCDSSHQSIENVKKLYVLRVIGVILDLLFVLYFIWATYYFIKISSSTFDGSICTGYGFLVIIFSLVQLGLCFYFLWPKVHPFFNQYILNPIIRLSRKIRYLGFILYLIIAFAIIGFLLYDTQDDRTRLIPLAGLSVYVILSILISHNRKKIPIRTVLRGLIAQFLFGLLTIRWQIGKNIIQCFGDKVTIFLDYAMEGAAFVYGKELIYDMKVFAFAALAAIYFLSFMVNILYYYNIMQTCVLSLGKVFKFLLGTSICESVYSITNIFLGMSESPLLIKPYIPDMTDAELLSIMTSGFATVAGTVLAAYISFGANAGDLITATVMSCPAALCLAKLLYPETEEIKVTPKRVKNLKIKFDSVLDAASKGAQEVSGLVIGIISGLIAFLSFVYFINGVLIWMGMLVGFVELHERWSLDVILGKVFLPVSYIMGVPWDECEKVAKLVGIKTVVNEFVAFEEMGKMNLTHKSKVIATFAICGFANPGSVGIMISTLSVLAPNRKEAITRLVLRAFIGGCFSCFMTACIAGMLTSTT